MPLHHARAAKREPGRYQDGLQVCDKDVISGRFTRAYQNNPATNSYALLGNRFSTTPIYNTLAIGLEPLAPIFSTMCAFGWNHVTLNNGTSWGSNVAQIGNTLGIGNGNPGSLPGLLALNFSNSALSNLGSAETGEKLR